MTTYRCACKGFCSPGYVCGYVRIRDKTCGAPEPESCNHARRQPPHPDDEGPSAGLDQAKAGKWRAPR